MAAMTATIIRARLSRRMARVSIAVLLRDAPSVVPSISGAVIHYCYVATSLSGIRQRIFITPAYWRNQMFAGSGNDTRDAKRAGDAVDDQRLSGAVCQPDHVADQREG